MSLRGPVASLRAENQWNCPRKEVQGTYEAPRPPSFRVQSSPRAQFRSQSPSRNRICPTKSLTKLTNLLSRLYLVLGQFRGRRQEERRVVDDFPRVYAAHDELLA